VEPGWSEAEGSAADGGGFAGAAAYGPALDWIGSGTVSGMEVRLLRGDYGGVDDGNPFWDPPPGCVSTGSWSVQVSTERFVAMLYAERYSMPDRPDGTVQLVGVPEGDPHWVAMADVGAAGATFTMPDGQQVPATDVGGRAVGVVRAPEGADVPQDEAGHRATLATPAGSFEVVTWWYPGDAFQVEHCQPPPPELPEPGVQPDDPDAARSAVIDALSTVFGNPDPDAKAAVLQHPDVVLAAMEAVAVNYPDITTEVEVVEVVFTAPDTAWFRYHLDADIARFDDQIGEARLVDGRWVITTETVCVQLRKGGGACEAPA
jgi:hypothetical protein